MNAYQKALTMIIELEDTVAELLEALETIASTVICNGDMSTTYAIDGAVSKQMHEAIQLAKEK